MYDILRFSGASASLSESIALSDSIVWRTGDSNFQSTEVLNSLKAFKVFVGPVLLGKIQDFAKTLALDLKRMAIPRDTNIRNYCLLECSSAQETRDFQQSRAVINHRIRHEHIMMSLAL
jgi:hypothetical protein